MGLAVVFAFAMAEGLPPVPGAAAWEALGRQLPRLLVQLLNRDGDRGLRFFPLLGTHEGRRGFLRATEPLPPATLAVVHRQQDVGLLVDGWIRADSIRLRAHRAADLAELLCLDLPFDPRDPLAVLRRWQFEVMGLLGLEGAPAPLPSLEGEALSWWIVGRDEVLALEANLMPAHGDLLRVVRECVARAPHAPEVRQLALDHGINLLRAGERPAPIGALLAQLANAAEVPADFHRKAGELAIGAGDQEHGADLLLRAAHAMPQDPALVERTAGLLYRQRRYDQAASLLMAVRACGFASDRALAQAAAVADRMGNTALRAELCEELLVRGATEPIVARVLIAYLFEVGRTESALELSTRALELEPNNTTLWLERARGQLRTGDAASAIGSIERLMALGPAPEVQREAERLLGVARAPDLLTTLQEVETAFLAGDRTGALQRARRLVRDRGDCAESWLLLGVMRHRMGQHWRAERSLRRAVSLQPGLAEAHNRLGVLLLCKGRAPEGLKCLDRARQLAPANPSILLHLAQACAMEGRHDQGEQHLLDAERLGADPGLLRTVRRDFFGSQA